MPNLELLPPHKDNRLTMTQISMGEGEGVQKRFPNLGEASLPASECTGEFIKHADFRIPLQEFTFHRSSPK